MVHIIKDDNATAAKSKSFTSPLNYKWRKVSAKRDFPQNCGRNAPRISPLPPQDADGEFTKGSSQNAPKQKSCGIVSAEREFPKSCGRNALSMNIKSGKKAVVSGANTYFDGCKQNAPQVIAKSSKDGASVGLVENVNVDTYGAFVESSDVEQLIYSECSGLFGRSHLLKSLISETTKSPKILNPVAISEPMINYFHNKVSLENSEVQIDDLLVDSLSVKRSGIFIESGKFEMTERPDQHESPQLPKALTPESTNALDVLHQLDTPKLTEALAPVVMDFPTSSAKAEFTSPSKELEYTGLVRNSDGPNSLVLLKSASQPVGKDLPRSLEQLPVDSVLPETLVQFKISDQAQASDSGEVVENSSHKKYPHRRRVSACRDFPLRFPSRSIEVNSFRNIDVGNKKASRQNVGDGTFRSDTTQNNVNIENGHSVDSRPRGYIVMKAILDEAEVKLVPAEGKQVKAFESNLKQKVMDETSTSSRVNLMSQFDINSTSNKVFDGDIDVSEENQGNESLQLGRNIGLKREFLGKHVYESCTVGNVEPELDSRSVVLALMAPPNCPWNIGKNDSKSQSSLSDATIQSKGKKHVDENCMVIQSQEKEHVGLELSKKRVLVLALMAAPNCPWNLGRRTSISPSGLNPGIVERKQEMLDLLRHDKPHPISDRENALVEKSEVKYTQNKLFLTRHDEEDDSTSVQTSDKMDVCLIPFGVHPLVDEHDNDSTDVVPNDDSGSLPVVQISHNMDISVIPCCGLHPLDYKDNYNEAGVTRNRVRETLRLFQGIVRKLMQDAESKPKDLQSNGPGRVDLISAKILKENHKWVNTGKQILGTVPGVEVGDEFHYRVELSVIGLHRLFQGGIDYVKRNGMIVATSIVASGRYADVMDSSDVLIYSGQGGIPPSGKKKAEDQKLVRGNLALKNSIDEGTPVRVIRGFKETKGNDLPDSRAKVVATYTYDGLYLVEKYWEEKGSYGTNVFKFQLRRIPGQPELPIRVVKKSKKGKVRDGLCIDDISQGKEKRPICAINTVDADPPPPFEYITHIMYPSWYVPLLPEGCGCTDGCSDSEKCLCAVKNGGEIPYNHDGAIVEAKTLVYECGPWCKCSSSCYNRVTQHGIKFQLEIFKTESRGWGVRSLNSIPSGSFICEYTGELLQDKEAEQRTSNDEYLFDIGHNYNDHAVSDMIKFESKSSFPGEAMEEDEGFTIDAAMYGSVGRFVNHSCSPNLYAQNVLYDHNDTRMPHIMLFAAENIPPLQELTYHYNYELGQVQDSEGNIKKKDCYCGSSECTGRMY